MNLKYIILFFCIICANRALPQSALDDDFTKEITYGINLNSNSNLLGGLFFKYGKIKNARTNITYGIEIVNVNHPKETKVRGVTNNFVYGKKNYFFSIRPHYGRDGILFRKAPQDGVQVNAVFSIGPSIGILKPYHILYDYGGNNDFDVRSQPYDPNIHNIASNFWGKGAFLEGLDKSEIVIGAHANIGLNFEVSTFKTFLTGIEAGVTAEAFTKEIIIMDPPGGIQNKQTFLSLYLNLYFGIRK